MSVKGTLDGSRLGLLLRLEGLQVGRYEVFKIVGKPFAVTRSAELYLAYPAALGQDPARRVVVKAMNRLLADNLTAELERTLLENYYIEVNALRRLHGHPNIIALLESGQGVSWSGRTFEYLILEYMSGGDLGNLYRNGPLPTEILLDYLSQITCGLTYSHDHGIIHRDLKLQNLLLTADRRTVKIADFGVAKIDPDNSVITRVGTPKYAAAEHNTALKDPPRRGVGPTADVSALAKVAFELLTNESVSRFAPGEQVTELPYHFSRAPWAPKVLEVLKKATNQNPALRHQSVTDFFNDFRNALLVVEEGNARDGTKTAVRAPSRAAKKPWIWTVTKTFILSQFFRKEPLILCSVAAALALIVLVLILSFSEQEDRQPLVPPPAGETAPEPIIPLGREAIAETYINIRRRPSARARKIGLCEKGSRVRIIDTNQRGDWYLVKVLTRVRPKAKRASVERGWIKSTYVTLR